MDGLVDSLMEELNCQVAFTIPIFGGIDVLESVQSRCEDSAGKER